MPELLDMFALSAPVLEQLVRGTVTYLVLLLLMRIVGRREAGGLGLTDVLVMVLVADAASSGLTGSAESIGDGPVLVCTILFWSLTVDALSCRRPWFSRIVKARPRPLAGPGSDAPARQKHAGGATFVLIAGAGCATGMGCSKLLEIYAKEACRVDFE